MIPIDILPMKWYDKSEIHGKEMSYEIYFGYGSGKTPECIGTQCAQLVCTGENFGCLSNRQNMEYPRNRTKAESGRSKNRCARYIEGCSAKRKGCPNAGRYLSRSAD